MKNEVIGDFQIKVSEVLLRNRSILDSLVKLQESTVRINRAVIKAVTNCGCISIEAGKQQIPKDATLKECLKYMQSHLKGKLCVNCHEIIEEEIGKHLFFLTATCNLLEIDLNEALSKEFNKVNTLGYFYLS